LKYATVRHRRDTRPVNQESTLDDFAEMLSEVELAQKDGRAFIPATFVADGRRCRADVEAVHALVLDVEKGASPRVFLNLWRSWPLVAYSSWSNTPAAPRFRVILPFAAPVGFRDYPDVWEWASRRSGGLVDPGCKDACRLYYFGRVAGWEELATSWCVYENAEEPLLDPAAAIAREEVGRG
jgi:hypothetical protein